ncbi:MAG: endo-1,4-beta-xylanase [Balneolaceae bacterium]
MKQRFTPGIGTGIKIVWLAALLTLTFGSPTIIAQEVEKISENGSFEDFVLGEVTTGSLSWTFNINANGADAAFEIVSDAQDDDERALKIEIGTFNGADDWNIEAVNEPLLVKEGEVYTASVWLKADTTTRVARFYFGLPASGNWDRFEETDIVLTTEWKEYVFEHVATATDEVNTMRFGMPMNFTENTGGTIYIDNLKITRPLPIPYVNENGSFESSDVTEQADTADVEGWVFELQDTGEANFAIVDDVVKDGERALRIDVTTQGANDWSIQAINELFPVEPELIYTFSVWAKASEAGGTANFTTGNQAFSEFGRLNNADVSLTTEWQEFTFEFQAGANDTLGRAPIHLNFAGNIGKSIWIDSLRITKPEIPDEIFTPIAEGKPKFLGNIYSNSQVKRLDQYWNQVTPENAGKWGSVEGTRDNMNWGPLDAAYNLAKENGFPFRFHVLVWGNQQPTWMKELSQEEQLLEIEEWFNAVADRYDDIEYLEVVNEPLHDPPTDQNGDSGSGGYYDALGGAGETGWDWVITSFEMAREIFPAETKLLINDYSILGNVPNTNEYLGLINLLKDRGLIDGIGTQAHAFSTRNSTAASINNSLNILGNTGLPIQITELDIDGNPSLSDSGSDQYQLEEYQKKFPTIWKHTSVIGVTLWGWRPGLWRNEQEAFLISNSEVERPALTWLREYVETTEVMVSNEEVRDEAPLSFKLNHNYPNPFNPSTMITFELPQASNVKIMVYDITGRLVETLVDSRKGAGTHAVTFNASNLSSGVYLYEIQAGSFREVKKMTLIK